MINVSLHLHEDTECDKYRVDVSVDEDAVQLEFCQEMRDFKGSYAGTESTNVYLTRGLAEKLLADLGLLLAAAEVETHG